MTHLRVYCGTALRAWRGCDQCGWVRSSRWEWLVRLRWWAHWLGHVRVWRRDVGPKV